MKYQNVHTGEVKNWKLEYLPSGRPVMVDDDGNQWFGINKAPIFAVFWKPVDDPVQQANDS